MATYASTTNPFITKSKNLLKNGLEGPVTKVAPGMARPQNILVELNKKKDANLLLSHEDSQSGQTDVSKDVALDENGNKSSMQNENKQDNKVTGNDEQQNSNVSSLEDVEDEIAKTCQSLVEIATRLSLEESEDNETKNELQTKSNLENRRNDIVENSDEDDGQDGDDVTGEVFKLNEKAPMEQDNRRYQHIELIKKLRLQLRDLERYAYERGELKHVPLSVLAERQTVVIETLKEKLSLNIDKDAIEKLELNELKKQVDKDINDLVDPLITKEYLLSQLKTQLTDLERYISHLHGTMGKNANKRDCLCQFHGCSSSLSPINSDHHQSTRNLMRGASLITNDTLPRTSRLIRNLAAQLICSDIKVQESAKKEQMIAEMSKKCQDVNKQNFSQVLVKAPQFHDGAAWTLHIDKVILATDSLMNLFNLEPQYQRSNERPTDEALVESVVRRQLVPAIKDLLTYGLIDPSSFSRSTSYTSFLFDPYYLLSSLTCFPSSLKSTNDRDTLDDKIHVWNVIEDYYKSRNEPNFKQSSVKTLSQSFNLTPSMDGPIKITSKQALLIAVDDIIERLAKCKPNGPDSHFKAFVYTALIQGKLGTWLRLVFKNKSVIKKYYHNFSFVSQPEKMDKFLATIEVLSQNDFKLHTDMEPVDQFVSAF